MNTIFTTKSQMTTAQKIQAFFPAVYEYRQSKRMLINIEETLSGKFGKLENYVRKEYEAMKKSNLEIIAKFENR